ncbi:MAG: radical SAM protein [Clostridiaceae bacterium]
MNREYIYHSYTKTLCNICKKTIDGKIVYNKNGVYILKNCPEHGEFTELLEEDFTYHLLKSRYDKPGTKSVCQTEVNKGCPYDCGLCPSHDQHTCIGLIEVTKRCNLKCEVCFADGGSGKDLSLEQIESMMDFYMESEGNRAEILQISGGEPTLHPEIINIIEMARNKGIKYVMLNTNGLRIAEDEDFAKELGRFKGGFEVYLQFDGLRDDIYINLRKRPLVDIKRKAISNLAKYSVPVTLVCTVAGGLNEKDLGEIIVYGMDEKSVRGVNFQPVAFFGRIDESKRDNKITLSGILNRIQEQTGGMIKKDDFMPLPCNVERVAITYLFKGNGGFVPITRNKDMSQYRDLINNTFMFTVEDTIKALKDENVTFGLVECCDLLRDIKKYIPLGFVMKSKDKKIEFVDENTFRISVSSFIDAYNFDMKSMQKECVHIITPDLKRIPFSSYNIIHRSKYDEYYI